ncbi:hypothetical protein D049_4890B, partial [Vibrio parahaemolyticus VPTS-2010]
ETSLSI